mmetsp:Transcript_29433/g.62451  ORF Transcript_29433/g.62451 Transcript_29433/m.62451 type:complete len:296 (-) Transcript_29433:91-978(-)
MFTAAIVLVLFAGAQGVVGDVGVGSKKLGFTNKNIQANPFGSCPLVLGYPSGDPSPGEVWQFDQPPCDYPGVTCFQDSARECGAPWPNTNIYVKEETVIAVFDGSYGPQSTSTDCPLKLKQWSPDSSSRDSGSDSTLDCPLTCFECAKACEMQANSVSQADTFRDPTLQGCNAWVFCTNPMGCKHSGGTVPGFSCTLKRIPMQNPGIQMLMAADGGTTLEFRENVVAPPKALVDQSSSGTGSDFVSGICNVRQTCTNTPGGDFQCDATTGGCGKCDTCGGYPFTCGGPCCPSCPC